LEVGLGKRLGVVVFGLALLAAACSSVSGPQSYTVQSDQPSPAGKKIQFSQWFPAAITAQPGDTIVFTNKSTEAPHTFTFGVKADRSNSPAPDSPAGLNPAVFGPCYIAAGASKTIGSCADHNLPAYNGKGYWNAGALFPGPSSKPIEIKLASDIPDGTYTFVCVLHSAMNGTLTIGKNRKKPADVDSAAASAEQSAQTAALAIKAPTTQPNVIAAGWGAPNVSYNEFAPLSMTVKVGTTVTWKDMHPEEPHTVTFQSPFKAPTDPGVPAPGGVKSGGNYSGGFANSGFIGGPQTFSLKFVKAGTYQYVCAIHPGMHGTVVVD
jgi:plastocyanin